MTIHSGKPNHLAGESSPYLLQHAYNPVDWFPWGPEALQKALAEDKPIILSIGYSSCHWCHVMERESFVSEEIAAIMNAHFVCIKVDREERPDIDQVYMDAIQAMGIHGGWPLNIFLTSEQKPFYGGTYFPAASWKKLLISVSGTYHDSKKEVRDSAEKLSEYISRSDILKYDLVPVSTACHLEEMIDPVNKITARFDSTHGGLNRAPKFPMPAFWNFLLHYSFLSKNKEVLDHVINTLNKIAKGGIYDQIGGGFARYSVDDQWFVPHFEKMLYDNAQSLDLYAETYRLSPVPIFREVVYLTAEFVKRELTHPSGGFYSALDADSEGEEGKYYIWTGEEIDRLFPQNSSMLKDFWGITKDGNWEGTNILSIAGKQEVICEKYGLKPEELACNVETARKVLLNVRLKRIRPGLDNKILTAWNALMVKGLVNAYITFRDTEFLEPAIKNAEIMERLIIEKGFLPRSLLPYPSPAQGFLDDYAFVMEAFIALYHATFNEKWINLTKLLAEKALLYFYDEKEELFYYTSSEADTLIARKKEIFDNVIPGSNSVMAINYFMLGHMLDNEKYQEISGKMIARIQKLLMTEPEYLSNWGTLFCLLSKPFSEIVVIGPEYETFCLELEGKYNPNQMVMGAEKESTLPLFQGKRALHGKTTLYVCDNKSCQLPVNSVEEAYHLLS